MINTELDRLVLVQNERDLLEKHLKDANLTQYNMKKLLAELKNAAVVPENELPEDAIRIDSSVLIQEELSGRKYDLQIVLPAAANIKENKISVFAPIGIALVGYRTGAKVNWEMPDGIRTFNVLRVMNEK